MSPTLVQPESLSDALDVLTEHGHDAKIVAGGTAVVLMLQQQFIAPEVLVDIQRLPDLADVRMTEDELHVGALTRLRDVEASPLVRRQYPALAHACSLVGNVRVRNQATLGGNLAEADYASDPPAVLLALDASVVAAGPDGSRTIPLADFFFGFYTTALASDEVLTDIVVPAPPPNSRMTYLKYKSRSSEDRPCVGVAAVAAFEGETCTDLRVAVGAACEVPQRLPEVEAMAHGGQLTDDVIADIAEGYADTIETLDDLRGSAWYRTQMIRVYVRRALGEVRDDHR